MAESTKDYKKFKLLHGNRRIDKHHVTKIGESMALYPEIFKIRPILVNDAFEIIDGQHRYYAAKELGIPVWYEKGGDIKTEDAVIINQNQRNWSVLDYARSYAARGNNNYKEFLRVHEEHPLAPMRVVMRYIGGPSKNKAGAFRSGEFEVVTLAVGEVYLEQLEELIEINERFALTEPSLAMLRIFQVEGYDHDRMIHKLKTVPDGLFNPYGKMEAVLRNLEDVYNWKQKMDVKRFY